MAQVIVDHMGLLLSLLSFLFATEYSTFWCVKDMCRVQEALISISYEHLSMTLA
jgi:hypothetical protein